jgi:hypothetical protein
MSGGKDKRPNLDRLMADARRRKFDLVVVWRFDRFARSTSHLLRALEEFNTLRIDFVSVTEAIDTRTSAGKMVFTVLGAVAELERSNPRRVIVLAQFRGCVVERRPDGDCTYIDPISHKYTGKPFPFRSPEGRVALVIEVEKARYTKLPFEHTPPN